MSTVATDTVPDDGRSPDEQGVPSGPGCQPTASAAEEASSRSGIPNAFTPAPWFIGERDYGLGQRVAATIGDATFTICNAETPLQGGHARHDMREANARLIAAAPELYEALSEYMECVGIASSPTMGGADVITLAELHDRMTAARANAEFALAKARGDAAIARGAA